MHELANAVAKILQRAVQIDARVFIQECAYIGKLRRKQGYMRLHKRPCAAIRDVRLFEVVRYLLFNVNTCVFGKDRQLL